MLRAEAVILLLLHVPVSLKNGLRICLQFHTIYVCNGISRLLYFSNVSMLTENPNSHLCSWHLGDLMYRLNRKPACYQSTASNSPSDLPPNSLPDSLPFCGRAQAQQSHHWCAPCCRCSKKFQSL